MLGRSRPRLKRPKARVTVMAQNAVAITRTVARAASRSSAASAVSRVTGSTLDEILIMFSIDRSTSHDGGLRMTQQPSVEEFTRFYLDEYEPASGPIEETAVIPTALLKRAADAGSYRLTAPAEFGGWGLTVSEYLPYLEGA